MENNNLEAIALKRIREVARIGWTELGLGSLELLELPVEIGELAILRRLILSYNKLTRLPAEIGNLITLEELSAPHNEIAILPVEIGKLKYLTRLDIPQNKLIELPPEIGQLTSIRTLNVRENQLKRLPAEIGKLTKLTTIDVSCNALIALPAEIGKLRNLEELNSSNIAWDGNAEGQNHITKLPKEIHQLKKLKILDLRGNPLPIPPEILEKYDEPQTILNYYFSTVKIKASDSVIAVEMETVGLQVDRQLNELKLLLVGQGSVGKTSLVQQILQGTFDQNQTKTEGISINQWQVERHENGKSNGKSINQKSEIRLNIWDFGGQEIMHATHQLFLTKRSIYLLVLDARLTQEENRVEDWLKIIQSYGGESPVLIVGNKTDQHPLDIDRTGLQKKYPNIVGILDTSAATGAGIDELKTEIVKQVDTLPHVRDLLPEAWFTVKSKLEEFGKTKNFITQDEYIGLCAMSNVTDETSQRTLIGFLHDLGVVLHFQDDPRLEALGILNPQWATNGVYKIINSHELFQNQGTLTLSLLNEILEPPEYPNTNKRLYIVDMMKKFELCYGIEMDKTFLVPDLLPKDQPELDFKGIPAFEYQYPVLPSSIITRFIVRMNQHIHENLVWRSGVVLKIGENLALVKADAEDKTISIAIDGLEHTRRDVLAAIRYQLDEIHDSIKGLNPQKRVPVPNAPNAEPLDYDYLLQLERDNELEVLPVKDGSRLVKVNIRQLLSGIESEAKRKEISGNITNIYVGGDVDGNLIAGNENNLNG